MHPWYNERCRELTNEKRELEGTPSYNPAVERCSRGLFQEYCKYTQRTREKLIKLRRSSKQWWRVSAQLMDKLTVSFGI